jgi:hypothetical protein
MEYLSLIFNEAVPCDFDYRPEVAMCFKGELGKLIKEKFE